MDQRYDAELLELTAAVFGPMLGVEVSPFAGPFASDERIAASIRIMGDWNGEVRVYAPMTLARETAGRMFGGTPSRMDDDLAHDALREVCNIIGGNLKSILPGENDLSLPSTFASTDPNDLDRREDVGMATVVVGGLPFLVMLHHGFKAKVEG